VADLFNFGPQKGKGVGKGTPPKGTPNNVWGGNKAAEIKAKEAELAKREKAIAAKEKEARGEVEDPNPGFNKEDSLKLKELSKQLSKLDELDEDDKALFYPAQGAWEAKIAAIKEEKQVIWARNRAKLPIEVQHSKQVCFVEKLEKELEEAKAQQQELLLKFQKDEDEIEIKRKQLVIKKAELDELAKKAAKEVENEPEKAATSPTVTLGTEQLHLFSLLQTFLANPKALEVFKAGGASDTQITDMGKLVSEVAVKQQQAAEKAKPPEGADTLAGAAPAAASNRGGIPSPATNGDAGEMDFEEVEPLWLKHLVDYPEVAKLEAAEQEKRKETFFNAQRALKRAKRN